MSGDVELLLADDSQADVKLTLNAFVTVRLGKQLHVVRDGEEALEFLFGSVRYPGNVAGLRLKLILLDLKLPKVTGLQVLKAVKSAPQTQAIPVVMLTSSNQLEDVVECYRAGANSYIQKPVNYDEFCDVVQQIEKYWLFLNQRGVPVAPKIG